LGDEFLDAVRAAARRAVEAPGLYQRIHGEMRRVLLGRFPYMLIFREQDDAVLVLGCVHGRRDSQAWQSRD
jgi:plasmid stabilization system protein ParE